MPTESSRQEHLKRWLGTCITGVLLAVGFFLLLNDRALLDWDTYQRVQFGASYHYNYADVHVLYHILLNGVVKIGFSSLSGVFLLTSISVSVFLLSAWWVIGQRVKDFRTRLISMMVLICASPGAVTLALTAEDNVSYLAPLLVCFHLLSTSGKDPSKAHLRAAAAGVLLAIAMMFNITALVLLGILPLAFLCLIVGQRAAGIQLTIAFVACLVTYYATHWLLMPETPIALHQFLGQALRLEDFGPTRAPLLSLFRVEQYTGGARAMFLTPTAYRMDLSYALRWILDIPISIALLISYLALFLWATKNQIKTLTQVENWPIATTGMVAITALFPFLYEPPLIERWDMLWLWVFLGLVGVLNSKPRAGMEVLLGFVVLIQTAGTLLVVTHHFFAHYENPAETEMRSLHTHLLETQKNPIVLPMHYDRYHLAYLNHHMPNRRYFLIGERNSSQLNCRTLRKPIVEEQVNCDDAIREIWGAPDAYLDDTVPKGALRPPPPPFPVPAPTPAVPPENSSKDPNRP